MAASIEPTKRDTRGTYWILLLGQYDNFFNMYVHMDVLQILVSFPGVYTVMIATRNQRNQWKWEGTGEIKVEEKGMQCV
jgi:hypothetical protein